MPGIVRTYRCSLVDMVGQLHTGCRRDAFFEGVAVMTDEGTATLSALDTDGETDTDARFSAPSDAEEATFSQAFLASLNNPADSPSTTVNGAGVNGTGGNSSAGVPAHLRTAWKRKQDMAHPIPGKPSARPALARGTTRPGTGGVRTSDDGIPQSAPSALPLPVLTHSVPVSASTPPPPPIHKSAPVSLRPAPLHPAVALYPGGPNPKAKPRGRVGREERPPSGTIIAGTASRPMRHKVEQWIGTALIAIGVLVAVGAFGGNYLMQRHTESENASFTASLSQFGPTPTPLTARATQIAARGSANAGSGGSTPPRPPVNVAQGGVAEANAAILPLPATRASTAPAIGGNGGAIPGSNGNGNGIDGVPVRSTSRPTAPGAVGVPGMSGGPPPIVAGGGQPMPRPQATVTATAMPRPADTPLPAGTSSPRPPDRNIAPPPIAAVQMVPATVTPQPQPAPPVQPALNADGVATAEPEPMQTPAPEPTPRQPMPTHLSIPALRVNSDVNEVGVSPTDIDGQQVYIWDVAAYAVGHHFSSANPGEGENVVFSGHDDWQGEVFRDLYKLKKGDKITVQSGDKTWSYHVDSVLLLQEIGVPLEQRLNNALYIGSTGDERLTMITCWPYGVDDHRLVVIARPDWCTDC